jgi:hypothetical protein
MSMNWGHWLLMAALFLAGFIVAKKYPSLFSSIPGLNTVTG